MAISEHILDEILKEHKNRDDFDDSVKYFAHIGLSLVSANFSCRFHVPFYMLVINNTLNTL